MEYGIQRRTIYLAPPVGDDLVWLLEMFQREEIWRMFGFSGPLCVPKETGEEIIGIIRRVADQRRIGFTICFPPRDEDSIWEFGFAIPEAADRDAFSAINAADAVGCYIFEHVQIEKGRWRIRADNRQSHAIARRMGFLPYGSWDADGKRFLFYRIDQERWAKRRAVLDRREETYPSGLGETFLLLEGPPYVPVQMPAPETPVAEDVER